MGINRWSDIEERKRKDAKAGDEMPDQKKCDPLLAGRCLAAGEAPAPEPVEFRYPRGSVLHRSPF